MNKKEISLWLKVVIALVILFPGFPLLLFSFVKIFFMFVTHAHLSPFFAGYTLMLMILAHHFYYTAVLPKTLYTIHSMGTVVSTEGYIRAAIIYTLIAFILSVPVYKLMSVFKNRKKHSKEEKTEQKK
ncbi:MAG: hypothetical protein A2017_02345 [Lentisphaerae bacterium GWF2_44_16]|nr:MAG: hypothetical protein A2017_02345 [Lentisphaerae bacterium GWF2_44_16]